ncbi:hypothetical protein CB1_001006003 [Camelus ferus]|nr:hypothetical protein CB1_001006003 [Camelus ferus]
MLADCNSKSQEALPPHSTVERGSVSHFVQKVIKPGFLKGQGLLTLKVSKLEKDVIFTPRAKKHQEQDSLIAGIIRVVEDNDILLHWASAQEARDSTQILFSKKDTGAGDSCTSEDELTFDQDYEPDGAVFSTVQPWPRHSQSTRGAEPSSRRGFWAFSTEGSCPPCLCSVSLSHLLLASALQDHLFCLVFLRDSSALSNSFHHLQLFDQASSNVVSRFLQDSCSTTFSSVSRVTNVFLPGALQPHQEGASPTLFPPGRPPGPGTRWMPSGAFVASQSSRNSEEIMKRQLEQLLKLLQGVQEGNSPSRKWFGCGGFWGRAASAGGLRFPGRGHPRASRLLLQRDLQAHNGLTTKPSVEDALMRAEALYSPLTACHVSP